MKSLAIFCPWLGPLLSLNAQRTGFDLYYLYFSSRPSNISALGLSFGIKECQFTIANRKPRMACFIRDEIGFEDGSALVGVDNDNLTLGVSSLFLP
jgi:hypothetical protein